MTGREIRPESESGWGGAVCWGIDFPGSRPHLSEIVIGETVMERVPEALASQLEGREVFWIWDRTAWILWSERVVSLGWPAPESGRVILFDASEANKRLAAVEELGRALVRAGADRGSAVVAVGGGVTGDVSGLLASLYMRGVPCVQIPTTLLAQVDSSIGGKTGVDLPEGKNLLGTFHQPRHIWMDVRFLSTLPAEEFRQGMAEVIKTALLGDSALWTELEEQHEALQRRETPLLRSVITACGRVKGGIVAADEREGGRRRALNLGHTVGHALERLTEYRMRHGDAVAVGLMAAAGMARHLGRFGAEDAARLERRLKAWDLPVRFPAEWSPDGVLDALRSDKKHVGGRLRFILPAGIGAVEDILDPDLGLLRDVLEELME